MPYAAYLRKSRADVEAEARGEKETLARHRTILTNLAAKKGHTIDHWYPEVVSGETISARPRMRELLSDVGAGKWSGIYVMEVERLARGDASDQGRVARTFLFSKTKIITPVKTYNPENEFDEEYFEFSLFMSRREYKTINRRIQAGRMQSIREGKYICSRPAYGYRKVKIQGDKGYTLEILPDEAAVVRQVFDWYLHGDGGEAMGLARIANRLLDMHVPVGAEGGGWKPCRIHRMLTNEVYIGMIRWGRVRTKKELKDDGIEKSLHMRNDYDLFPGLHPAIIDNDVFDAVQSKLKDSGQIPLRATKTLSNPLTGLIVCSNCGHTLRGKIACGRHRATIYCATHGCPTVRTHRQPVEDAILDALRRLLVDYQAQLECGESAQPDNTVHMLDASIQALESDRSILQEQKERLHDLLEQGIYSPADFAARRRTLEERIKTLDAAIADAKAQRSKAGNAKGAIQRVVTKIRHVLDAYAVAETAEEKNRLLKEVIQKVEYSKSVKGNQYVDPTQFSITVYPRII